LTEIYTLYESEKHIGISSVKSYNDCRILYKVPSKSARPLTSLQRLAECYITWHSSANWSI